ncbi:MAG: hypothetical protein M3O36_13565 [Myxococcota bacterium]|nr:hypothetical protein [Myxococcota bacterium]
MHAVPSGWSGWGLGHIPVPAAQEPEAWQLSTAGGHEIGLDPTQVPATHANVWSHLLADVLKLHATPQPPQLPLSVCGFTQTLPQSIGVTGLHVGTQLVPAHVNLPFAGFAGHVAQVVPPQFILPGGHGPQMPPLQFMPVRHMWPQAPQLALSLSVSTSQPSAALWLQSAFDGLHAMVQCPLLQLAVPPVELQTWPQAPQLFVSVLVLVSQPSAGLLLQSPKPGAHGPIMHFDATHVSVTWFVLHGLAQPLQFAGSLVISTHAALLPFPHRVRLAAQD